MDRLFEVVDQALQLPAEERESYLLEAYAGNAELLAEARRLVAAEVPMDFLEPPSRPGNPDASGPSRGARLGDFELLKEVGRGGMGTVYRARQLSLGRVVAVKVLAGGRRLDPLALERFQREAVAASKLSHSALVSVMASGVEEDCAWFAMPLIEGHDLHAELMEQSIANYGAAILPAFGTPEYTSAVCKQIAHLAEGLEHAHSEGVIHRDVKPRNILIDRHGEMWLADFGLAKSVGDQTITETGALQGTPFYMSPEQTRALRDPIGPRTDVYSLSVVLYELLTLRRPFQGEDLQDLLNKISSGTPEKLRALNTKIPRDLCVICETGMSHRPSDRYETARALAEDLHRFLAGESILAQPLPLARRATRWMAKHPWKTLIPGAAAAVLVTGFLVARAERKRTLQDGILSSIRALTQANDPSPGQLAAAWAALGKVDRGDVPSLRDHPRVLEARSMIEVEIQGRLKSIDEAVLEGKGPRFDSRFGPDLELAPEPAKLVDGIVRANEGAALFPGHAGLEKRAMIAGILPRVDAVVADSLLQGSTAAVYAQLIDPLTGDLSPVSELGPTPVKGMPLSPGIYRFTVVLSDGRFAEIERELEFGSEDQGFTFWPRTQEEIAARCVLVEPESEDFPEGERTPQCWIPQQGALLESFWLSRSELSHGDYLEFLKGTSMEAPGFWLDAGFDAIRMEFTGPNIPVGFDFDRWKTLPCVLIPYAELRLAAEWFGLRVPTHLELEYGHRGSELRLQSSSTGIGEAPSGAQLPVVGRADFTGNPEHGGYYFHVCSQLEPVQLPAARTEPLGLYHPLGNVAEFTSTLALAVSPTITGSRLGHGSGHTVLGVSWLTSTDAASFAVHESCSVEAGHASNVAGLRPAISSSAATISPPR
ncbi:Serine/threonine-protein kinase PrkC [Planctomycetes bacterium Poly30]|uniref:Serine/threonine-protein kinase PrkC n=2 Tax=Saltatorellus ferox TaxID=2528018 RepID=A0A518ET77_9BACT|nr:Serine/threonine-protein kinase PrkC [Planctomycetes bacterium Poly30]